MKQSPHCSLLILLYNAKNKAVPVQRLPFMMENVHPSEVLHKLCKEEHLEEALQLVDSMDQQGISITRDIIYDLLQGCIEKKGLDAGRRIYSLMVKSGLDSITVLGDHLIRLFASSGSLDDANKVFSKLSSRSVYTWNAIISAYDNLSEGDRALALYYMMQQEGIKPNVVTFLYMLRVCSRKGALGEGRWIHHEVIRNSIDAVLVVRNALINMYAKCGSLDEARKVFDGLPIRDVVSWGTIIAAYAQHTDAVPGLELLEKMQDESLKPERVTFLCILKACGSTAAIRQGRLIHGQILARGFESDVVIGSSLVHMYVKCKHLGEAHTVFDRLVNRNVVLWGAMIAGYVQQGHVFHALELYDEMKEEGIKPDKVTFSSILKACGILGLVVPGMSMHEETIRCGLESDIVIGSSLVDIYAKCGSIEDAHKVFDKVPNRDVVTWATMIAMCAHYEQGLFAFELFKKMQVDGINPDKVMLLGILKACSSVGALEQGRCIHHQTIKSGFELDMLIGNTLVDMYGKCGSLEESWNVFTKLPHRDVASWGAVVAGFAQCGNIRQVQQCLEDMRQEGLKPGVMIFSSILTACSHGGQLEEGWAYFKAMQRDYDVIPSIEHYNCMLDLLSRLGRFCEAEDLLRTMPTSPDVVGWVALLTACRTYGNVKLGKQCFDEVVKLDLNEASGYVLMSSIYAVAEMWKDVDKIHEQRQCVGAWKKPGMAWIEVRDVVNEFIAGGENIQQNNEVIGKLKILCRPMKEGGHVPRLESVLEPL